ncbi:MAG TPA: hypothetical protein VLM40_14960 [Gemmata sp.]|nr:hypothetical protein [Gemmata sp.]
MWFLFSFGVIGAPLVILIGALLLLVARVRRWGTGCRLAVAHTLVVLGFMTIAPLEIRANWGSPYGDLYFPYFFVPGVHIYFFVNQLFNGQVFIWLLGYMESFPASVLCIIVGPGLLGMLVGDLQWYLIGAIWDRVLAERRK